MWSQNKLPGLKGIAGFGCSQSADHLRENLKEQKNPQGGSNWKADVNQ